jgi:hypothetical protein
MNTVLKTLSEIINTYNISIDQVSGVQKLHDIEVLAKRNKIIRI